MKKLFTILYGSQNYDLATADSDKDYITVYMPDIELLYRETKIFHGKDEHHRYEDIRQFISRWAKSNFNYIEMMYSVNVEFHCPEGKELYQELVRYTPEVVYHNRDNFFKSCQGMAYASYLNFLDKKNKNKHAARLMYFYNVLENYQWQDFTMENARWRCPSICFEPRLVREGLAHLSEEAAGRIITDMNRLKSLYDVPKDERNHKDYFAIGLNFFERMLKNA